MKIQKLHRCCVDSTKIIFDCSIQSNVRNLTTGIDTAQANGWAILISSKSGRMISFFFANGDVITLRTSDTESEIKYFGEMCARPDEKYV